MALTLTHVHVLTIGGTSAYDLRKTICWNEDPNDSSKVQVRFQDNPNATVRIDKTTFENAKLASLNATNG